MRLEKKSTVQLTLTETQSKNENIRIEIPSDIDRIGTVLYEYNVKHKEVNTKIGISFVLFSVCYMYEIKK